MPQRSITKGSFIITTSLIMLLTMKVIFASPIQEYHDQEQEQDQDDYDDESIDQKGRLLEKFARHSVNKRSFYDIKCKGIYDKSIFARVDQICEDCYNLFREPKLHTLCRQNCFTSEYFKGCVDVLLLTDELASIQEWITKLNGLSV